MTKAKRIKLYEQAIFLIYMDHHDGTGMHYGLCTLFALHLGTNMDLLPELNCQRPQTKSLYWFGSTTSKKGLYNRMAALEKAIALCDK